MTATTTTKITTIINFRTNRNSAYHDIMHSVEQGDILTRPCTVIHSVLNVHKTCTSTPLQKP